MNAHASALAFATALVQTPGLENAHIYAHDTEVIAPGVTDNAGEIELPAVFVKVSFESGLSGSNAVGRAKVEIQVESQSDDETIATHSARESAVRECMGNMLRLSAAFTAIASVELLGRPACMDLEPGTEHRAFITPLLWKAGIRAG